MSEQWEVKYTKIESWGRHTYTEHFSKEQQAWKRERKLWNDPAVQSVRVRKVK